MAEPSVYHVLNSAGREEGRRAGFVFWEKIMCTQNNPTSRPSHLRSELPAHFRRAPERAYERKVSNVWGRLSKDWVSQDKISAENISELVRRLAGDAYVENSGLMPRSVHLEKRVYDIIDAIRRCRDAGMKPDLAWFDELADVAFQLREELNKIGCSSVDKDNEQVKGKAE